MASTNFSDAENIVISILSAHARSLEDWQSLAQNYLNSKGLETCDAGRLLDSEDTDNHGRIFEILGTFPDSHGEGDTSLDQCKGLRNSELIQSLQDREKVEIIIQPLLFYWQHRTPGLAVFDMDSTLIQQEVIDELARAVGRYDEVAAVTEAAMRGELDFSGSLRARVAKLKGVDANIWEKLKQDVITITPGARLLIKSLKGLGWKTAVLSGGFTPLANWLKEELGLDYAFANHLALDDTKTVLSGELVPGSRIIDGTAKRDLLLQLAEENSIRVNNVFAVGDGSNDLLMMNAAGWGIAFNAKPKVQAAAPARLNSSSLLDIMYLLGYTKAGIARAAGVDAAMVD